MEGRCWREMKKIDMLKQVLTKVPISVLGVKMKDKGYRIRIRIDRNFRCTVCQSWITKQIEIYQVIHTWHMCGTCKIQPTCDSMHIYTCILIYITVRRMNLDVSLLLIYLFCLSSPVFFYTKSIWVGSTVWDVVHDMWSMLMLMCTTLYNRICLLRWRWSALQLLQSVYNSKYSTCTVLLCNTCNVV